MLYKYGSQLNIIYTYNKILLAKTWTLICCNHEHFRLVWDRTCGNRFKDVRRRVSYRNTNGKESRSERKMRRMVFEGFPVNWIDYLHAILSWIKWVWLLESVDSQTKSMFLCNNERFELTIIESGWMRFLIALRTLLYIIGTQCIPSKYQPKPAIYFLMCIQFMYI